MITMEIPKKALPSFFQNAEIVTPPKKGRLSLMAADDVKNQKIDCEISATTSPILFASKKVKQIYQNNDFAAIKKLEEQSQKDLQPIYENIKNNKEKAWTRVRSGGEEFLMSWSESGSMWVRTVQNGRCANAANETSYSAVVQVGTYTASGGIMGIQSYNLTLPTVIVEVTLSYIIAVALSEIVATGLGFVVTAFALAAANAAAALGFTAFSCTIAAATLSTVATCLVFAVVFIGLTYLWNWLNRKYTIRLQIFNWDKNNDWSVDGSYYSNAVIAGSGTKDPVSFSLPKLIPAGSSVTPPGFQPVEALDSVCYYATVVWENDNTFMEGCAMALRMKKGSSSEGFAWAFSCPRFADNTQAAADGYQDPLAYYQKGSWNKSPKNFSITATNDRIPVSFGLDALSGASDNLYNVTINIGK